MDLKLKDKTVMVAAASKGLGFGIAAALAAEGAQVSIASRDQDNIERALAALKEQSDAEIRGYLLDAASPESIDLWKKATVADFGTVDGLVVNAGGPPPGKFEQLEEQDWKEAFELTLMSAVRMIRGVLPIMKDQGSGSILTVTSTSIKEPIDILLLSNVFRSGVVSLVKSLSKDLAPQGIRINNLVPGRIDTERVRSLDSVRAEREGLTLEEVQSRAGKQIPLGRYGTIEEFGAAAAFLLSDCASYITGSSLIVDGGTTKTVW